MGLITRSDVAEVPQGYWNERTVGETMRPLSGLLTFTLETPLADVLSHIDADDLNPLSLLVIDAGQLAGMIEPRELTPLLDVQDVLGLSIPPAPASRHEPQRVAAEHQLR